MSALVNARGERVVRLLAPEGTELDLELASPAERAVAYIIDEVLIHGLLLLLALALLPLSIFTIEAVAALFMLASFVLNQGYFLFFEVWLQGSTPAKRLMGIRVISRDGSHLRIETIAARSVMRNLEVMLPIALLAFPEQVTGRAPWWLAYPAVAWILVVALLPFLTRERTRAGDLVAGTVVVRVPRSELLRDEARGTKQAPIRFTREQLAFYGEHELETLATLLRSIETGRADEEDLRVVAETIARRIRYEGSEPTRRAATFLRAFYRDQRTELERHLVLGKRIADKHERKESTAPGSTRY